MKFNHRSRLRTGVDNAARGVYRYEAPRFSLDMNLNYSLTNHLDICFSARNVTNEAVETEYYCPEMAPYAHYRQSQEHGVPMYIGSKGKF